MRVRTHLEEGIKPVIHEKHEGLEATGTGNEPERFRTTIYLTEEELCSLDELKALFRRQEGRQIGKSEIIREAIRYYHANLREQ